MSSSYTQSITKVKNALENVYVKKSEFNDILGLVFDSMIETEPLEVKITNVPSSYKEKAIMIVEYDNTSHVSSLSYKYINNTISFIMPDDFSTENSFLMIGTPPNVTGILFLYSLEDNDNDKVIIENYNNMPQQPKEE